MIENLENLFKEYTDFSLETFKEATALSSLIKLKEEIREIKECLFEDNTYEELAKEYVDGIMCLVDSAARAGVTSKMLHQKFAEKLAINKSRKWIKNPDNTYSYIK